MEMLASGSFAHGEQIFGSGFDSRPDPTGVCSVAAIEAKAERAQPKPTQANPLYANFGKPRHGAMSLHHHMQAFFLGPRTSRV